MPRLWMPDGNHDDNHQPVPTILETEPRTLEHVEADTRFAMSQHASIKPRGFDSIKTRAELHHAIDRLLDEWILRGGFEQMAAAS